jgi:hypothetical protein
MQTLIIAAISPFISSMHSGGLLGEKCTRLECKLPDSFNYCSTRLVEEFYGTRYQSGSFSLNRNVGSVRRMDDVRHTIFWLPRCFAQDLSFSDVLSTQAPRLSTEHDACWRVTLDTCDATTTWPRRYLQVENGLDGRGVIWWARNICWNWRMSSNDSLNTWKRTNMYTTVCVFSWTRCLLASLPIATTIPCPSQQQFRPLW